MEEKDSEMDIPIAHLADYNPGGNPRLAIKEWQNKMEAGTLTITDFKDHWRKFVPRYFSIEPGSDRNSRDNLNETLIEILETFIADGDFQEELKKVRLSDKPPSVCGRVFKMGEPTYSCRECGMDSTCVLCVSCFKKSPHRNHNYKMGTSPGGGCCDCGDVEAWKTGPYCDVHLIGSQVTEERVSTIPEAMAERSRLAFTAILRYAYQILTLQHSPRLPHDLRPVDRELAMDSDVYCTVLYNDEVHTFDQVITTLNKVVKCQPKDSIEFVTNIDREGRAVVKCGMFQQCQELKADVERYTSRHGGQPLRVDMVHVHVIAHQDFAMRLLRWLQETLALTESLRNIFTEVALKVDPPETSIVEGILLRDHVLWKAARSHWHRLFISGLLMEYSSKMAFAKVFTKNYGTVIKDFIRDDHDHSFSVASLSVQIFTVPTLALHLIAHEEVLFVLLNTFLSECTPKLNKDGNLQFERNGSISAFKRAQYILYDLRYLLSNVPSPEQWTDELRRGFLQGLNLFLKLMTYMEGMDDATRQVAQHMEFEPEWESAFNLHIKLAHVITLLIDWCGSDKVILVKAFRACLRDLAETQKGATYVIRELANHSASCIQYDVSTQPVSVHLPLSRFFAGIYLHLDQYGMTFDSLAASCSTRPVPVQIMEPVLRTLVMIAQVHAGMWRRNGYSILNQIYFYHNVRCRGEMLDRDIVMLQIGASLVESDEFLIHVVNKFGLMPWADPAFEDQAEDESMRQTIALVEEMLGVLITLTAERFVPGVGQVKLDDRIKKEIIQQLCIKPLSHSELNKTLPDDVNHETGLERVIDDIATFRKPDNSGKGVYELKDEFHDQYNLFYYHYTREEFSKSEEIQRRRRKNKGLFECAPPPPLPALAPPFETLPNLLQCDVMMYILQTVLARANNLKARSFSENQLQKALHIIGFALQEEQSQRYPFLRFAEKSIKWDLEKLVKELSTSPRVESHKDMMLWVLERFKMTKEEAVVSVAVPVADKDVKEWRAKMAAEKRAKIMAQMAAMQKSFMAGNAHLLGAMECEAGDTEGSTEPAPVYTCILCQQETAAKADGPALVFSTLLQKSTVHVLDRKLPDKADEVFSKPIFRSTSLRPQLHTSTCGHVMHSQCWQLHFENILMRETRRPYRLRQPTSFDVDRQEFLCPLCECLGNTVIPILPPLPASNEVLPDSSFSAFLKGLETVRLLKQKVNCYQMPLGDRTTAGFEEDFLKYFPVDVVPELSASLKEMLVLFAESSYSRQLYSSSILSLPLAWDTISYTIHSTAMLIEDKPLLGALPMRHSAALKSLATVGGWFPKYWKESKDVSDQAAYLISLVLESNGDGPCLLDLDCFSLLVPLILSLPSLFEIQLPKQGWMKKQITRLCFYANVVTCLLSNSGTPESDMETDEPVSIEDTLVLLRNASNCQLYDNSQQNWWNLKMQCLPFLRRAVLFFHYLFDASDDCMLSHYGEDTFENLCSYLSLPSSPDEVLGDPEFCKLAKTWAAHPRIPAYLISQNLPRTIVPSLQPLAKDYSELINLVSTFYCPNSDRDDSRNPTMCLVCGEMLCSQSYCCQQELNKTTVGACTYHAHRCGAGVGMFLRVRECEVLLLATQSRGCFITAPYVDRYGETDQGLRRGNPLTLCEERYKKLEKLWLGHQLYEEIARAVEQNSLMTTPWQHL